MAQPRILIVESDASIAHLFTEVFTQEGYAVAHVPEPEDVVALLCASGPDAFDLVLCSPGTDAQTAHRHPYARLDQVRACTHAPIVICTRFPVTRYADYQAHGYAAILEEPFEIQTMLDLVALVRRKPGRAHDQRPCAG